MKELFSIVILGFSIVYISSCKNKHAYDKYIKELDSLKIVVEQAVDNFKTIDSTSCFYAYSKQQTYIHFLNSYLKDTVTKTVAENLQNFMLVGNGLGNYIAMRTQWLSRAQLSIKQLSSLSYDLKSGSVETEEAIEFINEEKKQAEQVIEELKLNTESIRKHLDLYAKSLPIAEDVIKKINHDSLPPLTIPEIKYKSE